MIRLLRYEFLAAYILLRVNLLEEEFAIKGKPLADFNLGYCCFLELCDRFFLQTMCGRRYSPRFSSGLVSFGKRLFRVLDANQDFTVP